MAAALPDLLPSEPSFARPLHDAETRANLLVQHLSDLVCVMDPDGTLTYVSPSCGRLLGCTAAALTGTNLFRYVHPDKLPAAVYALEQCAADGTPTPPLDLPWRRADGAYVRLEAFGYNLLHEPAMQGLVVTARDVTERCRAIEALEQSLERERQVNELRSSFVAMASHEFRTPLATILSSANLAERFLDKSREKATKHLQRIAHTVEDMLHLLDDILDLERIGAEEARHEVQRLELRPELDALLEEIRIGVGAGRTIHLTGDVPRTLDIDRTSLRLVLGNLLTNALKYSPGGESVLLDVSPPEPGAPVALFRVTDRGIGIPRAELPLLFEPFHRAANVGPIKGTGLGLAMVRQTVERLGGTIRVESVPGEGSTFEVMLPLYAPRKA